MSEKDASCAIPFFVRGVYNVRSFHGKAADISMDFLQQGGSHSKGNILCGIAFLDSTG